MLLNVLNWAQQLINLEIPVLVRSLKSSNVDRLVGDGGLNELDDVEEEGDDEDGAHILDQTLSHCVRVVHCLEIHMQ